MDRLRLALAFLRAFLSSRPAWLDTRTGRLLPMIAGADGADDGGDDADDGDDSKDDAGADKGNDDGDDADKVGKDDDWKTKARKHETAAKRERKERERLAEQLKKLQDKDKSEQEKALEKAREEGKAEALTAAEQERRSDRLEVAVTRLAARGIKVGEGDDAKTIKFADPDDALLRIERAISRGDVDPDDIFDDQGKPKGDALTAELADIASSNPHLVGEGKSPGPSGDADTRKGGPADKDLEAMSPEDHAKRKYGDQK